MLRKIKRPLSVENGRFYRQSKDKIKQEETRAIRQPGYPFQGPAALRRRITPAFLLIKKRFPKRNEYIYLKFHCQQQ
jgi:hypothetical protein